MMATSPAYEPIASSDTSSLDVDQSMSRWPTAYLPRYSTVSSSCWLKEAASELLQTFHDFDDIKLICKFASGLNPTTVATLLSSRRKGWLDAFLNILCRDEAVEKPPCDSVLSTAEAIVAIIRQRPLSPALVWNGDWIFSALITSTDIATIAKTLDAEIHSTFCTFPFEDWVSWCCGYRNDGISNFLDTVFNFRNSLARCVPQRDRLLLLQQTLPSRQPLPYWIVSTAISFDTSSHPSEALRFFLDPICQLLEKQSSGILPIVRRLSILGTRFKLKIVHATDVNWPNPFSINFLFWENIHRDGPDDLAKSNTESVSNLYSKVSPAGLPRNSECMKNIARLWSDLSDDILACLIVDGKLAGYFMDFAEHLLLLRNVHSAAAVGLALWRWGFQPRKPLPVWDIINPEDNFAGCREYMAEEPCIPLIFLYLVEPRRSGNASDKLFEAFQFAGCFGARKGAEVVQTAVVPDVNGENSQQSDLNTKRIKSCDIMSSYKEVRKAFVPRIRSETTDPGETDFMTTRPGSCSISQNAVGEVINANRHRPPAQKDLYPKPFCAHAYRIAFQEQYAIEIWALRIQGNYQIFKEALQQVRMMLLGIADAPIIALEMLAGLKRTQMVLLSSVTEVTKHDFSVLSNCSESKDWKEEKQAAFSRKFTRSVPGPFARKDILDSWDELFKVLVDKKHLRSVRPNPSL